MHGQRTDSLVAFFDRVSLSKHSCAILFDLASSANLAIDGDTFSAVTSTEAQQTMGLDYSIVRSAEELYQLIQSSFEDMTGAPQSVRQPTTNRPDPQKHFAALAQMCAAKISVRGRPRRDSYR